MFMISSFFAARWASRIGGGKVIFVGILFTTAGAVGLLVAALAGYQSFVVLLIASGFMGFGNGIVIPTSISEAVGVDPRLSGTASAWVGVTQMLISAGASQMYGFVHNGTLVPVAALMSVMAGFGIFACVLIGRRRAPAAV